MFFVNIAKLLRTSILKNICERLLLDNIFFLHFNLFIVSAIAIYYENMTKTSMECKNKHCVKR